MKSIKSLLTVMLFLILPYGGHVVAQADSTTRAFGAVEMLWGKTVSARVVSKLFTPGSSQIATAKQRSLFKGRVIWRWSVDDSVPDYYTAEVSIRLGDKTVFVPKQLLEDLWLPNDDLAVWASRDGKVIDMRFSCADGGVGVSVHFQISDGFKRVSRYVYKDSTLVDKQLVRLK